MTIDRFLNDAQDRVNHFFKTILPAGDSALHEAMRYAIENGGKRIRPALVYAVGEAFGFFDAPSLDYIAASIECMHSYSLVHDDLPAMDDDDLRRGKPSCHVAFDEATAILCGDALQCFSFELLTSSAIPAEKMGALVSCLAKNAGYNGMALGQHYDLIQRANTEAALREMHALKTGRLIEASIAMPCCLLTDLNPRAREAMIAYAKHIGLAYQICDDILDCTQSTEMLGKPAQSDEKNEKQTYVSFYGLEKAREMMQAEVNSAQNAITALNLQSSILAELADYFIARTT